MTPTGSRSLPYHEVAGNGPTLILAEAGLGDAESSRRVAELLEEVFTVVRFDRRGLSRSADSSVEGAGILGHAQDVVALTETYAAGPARLFGASIGALVVLEALSMKPALFSHVVAHEPPLEKVVADVDRALALDDVAAAAESGDALGAIKKMGAIVRSGDVREEDAPTPEPSATIAADIVSFLASDFASVRDYDVPFEALSASSAKLLVTGGALSSGRFEYRCAVELARRTGAEFAEIEAGHSALVDFPRAVADLAHRRLL